MVLIIIHIAYITDLVSHVTWHAYDVIGVYKIHRRASEISYFAEQAILWLTGAVMGVVGVRKFNGVSNTEVGKHGYGLGRGP